MNEIETLHQWMQESERVVFFGGAGASTESGIPDFRSTDGLYNQQYDYPPEQILSHTFFMRWPEEFFRFYRDKMLAPSAKPNKAHRALAKLEEQGKLTAVITQNIDGLHQMAGSKKVLELHGSVHRNYCMRCHKFHSMEEILHSEGVPRCSCGGIIKPDVVLYEEGLDQQILQESVDQIRRADMLIIGGTSLTVYPAAGLLDYYTGNRLVLINKTATARDGLANLVIKRLGYKARSEKPGLLGRASIALSSDVDRAEAILAGEEAVRAACAGESGKMVGFIRESAGPYKVRTTLIDVHDVMLVEKKMPDAYINEAGNGVTQAFLDWCAPLIGEPLEKLISLR